MRMYGAVIGVLGLAAAAAAGCNDAGGNNSATFASCRAYCDTVIGAGCPMPIYSSADTCKAYECSSLDSTTEGCQKASKAYYDCAAAKEDLCASSNCTRELDAAHNCATGGRGGAGSRQGVVD